MHGLQTCDRFSRVSRTYPYIDAAKLRDRGKTPLFRSAVGRTGLLTDTAMHRIDAYRMIQRRAAAMGLTTRITCHTFRATGITAYMEAGGTLEKAQRLAAHESPRTTKLYNRTGDAITLDEVERIRIERMDRRISVRSSWNPRGPIAGEDAMQWITATLLAVMALAGVTAQAMTGGSVATTFRGTWVPAAAACTSPLKLVIEATMVTFVHGTQRAEYRQLEPCFTCMGRDVEHVTLLSTDAMGDSPCLMYLDASTKQASVRTDCSTDKPLGARLPFGAAALQHGP